MRVSDLLRAGGGLDSAAYGDSAELIRAAVTGGGARQTELIQIDLAALRRGDAEANVLLQPFDHLIVKETPEWGSQGEVTLRGEVRFPGAYPIRRGETLRQLLDRLRNDMTGDERRIKQHAAKRERSAGAGKSPCHEPSLWHS